MTRRDGPAKGTRVVLLIQRNAVAAISSYSGMGSSLEAGRDLSMKGKP